MKRSFGSYSPSPSTGKSGQEDKISIKVYLADEFSQLGNKFRVKVCTTSATYGDKVMELSTDSALMKARMAYQHSYQLCRVTVKDFVIHVSSNSGVFKIGWRPAPNLIQAVTNSTMMSLNMAKTLSKGERVAVKVIIDSVSTYLYVHSKFLIFLIKLFESFLNDFS